MRLSNASHQKPCPFKSAWLVKGPVRFQKAVPDLFPHKFSRNITSRGVSILSLQTEFYLCLVLIGLLSAVTFYVLAAIIYTMTALCRDKSLGEKEFTRDTFHS